MTQNKVYLVLNAEKDTVDYTIFVPGDEDIYVLRRSSDTQWSEHVRDEVVLTILDSGNGFKVKWEEPVKNKMLDYSQAVELTILLNFINAVDKHPFKFKIIDSDDLIDLM
jgi:hypothetical protein